MTWKPELPSRRLASKEDVAANVQVIGQREVLIDRLDPLGPRVLRIAQLQRRAVEQQFALIGPVDA